MPHDFSFLLNIVTIVLGNGIFIFVYEVYKKAQENNKEKKFLAIKLSNMLEGYAIECGEAAIEHDAYKHNNGVLGNPMESIPAFPALPEENYKLIDYSIYNRLIQFPQTINSTIVSAYLSDPIDPNQTCIDLRNGAICIGFSSLQLAQKIRSKYKLPERNITREGDPTFTYLNEEKEKIR